MAVELGTMDGSCYLFDVFLGNYHGKFTFGNVPPQALTVASRDKKVIDHGKSNMCNRT